MTEAANATVNPIKKELRINSNGILFLIFSEDQTMSCTNGKMKVITKTDEQKRVIEILCILLSFINLWFAFPNPDDFMFSEFSLPTYKMTIAKKKSIRDIFAPDIKSW